MYYKDIFFDHETAGDMDKTVTLLIEKSYRSDFFCFGVGFFAVSDLGRSGAFGPEVCPKSRWYSAHLQHFHSSIFIL
jgi:hypothetical protein